MTIAGNPRAELWVSTDSRDADYAMKLCDVWSDGRVFPVAEGVLRLTHRDTDLRPSPVEPNHVYKITVDLGHTAVQLGQGHALRVEIAGSYFPVYDRNSHTGEGPFSRSARRAIQTIHHSASMPSRVLIPVQ